MAGDEIAKNRGHRAPKEGSGEAVGSGAGAGGGGAPEDLDNDEPTRGAVNLKTAAPQPDAGGDGRDHGSH